MTFSFRTNHLKPEGAYQMLAKANQMEASGREIVHFEIGEPDLATFSRISAVGIRAIGEGHTHYTSSAGLAELRKVLAEDCGIRRNIHIEPDEVVIGPGAKPALFFPTLALIETGDEVIYPNPGFPTYEAMIKLAGGIPVSVPLLEKNNFSLDLGVFDQSINKNTKLIILNSPNNPTGGVIPQSDLEHIAEKAQQFNCWVMSDEIYGRIVYDGLNAPSIASIPGMQSRTIIVDGFSKTYAMTGWRLGYGIMPSELAKQTTLLLTHSVGSTAEFSQYAGIEAIRGPQDEVETAVKEYQFRRDLIVAGLNSLKGVTCQTPQGAFYAFPNILNTGLTSSELADHLLEKAGVALLPGSAFGEFGEGYLRLSYANSIKNIELGITRMQSILGLGN